MMSDGTGYQIIAVGIRTIYQELSHAIAYRCTFDMLAESPPTIVVHLAEVILRTVEERHVLAHPL